jgi:hypothetical protein
MVQTNARTGQLYGYAVCLICVIVFLVSLGGILGAAFDLTDPVRADYHGGMGAEYPLTSFPAYKIAVHRQAENRPGGFRSPNGAAANNPAPTVSDDELRQNYEAERAERIGAVQFRAMRTLVIGLIFILLTAGLFTMHWKWLRRTDVAVS